jgi:LPXTG-motif cell wall-anchored protein
MKKRLFGTLLAAALVVTQVVSVFAAGSKTTQATPAGESVGKYEITEGTAENFSEVKEQAVLDKILAVNNGTATLESIAEQAEAIKDELTGKVLVTKFFDLVPINGGVKTEDGKYKVTFTVPNLTEALQDVKVLHYSTQRAVWEVITPDNVNYSTKEITAQFEDLSPVAVIGKNTGAGTSTDSTTGTSPKTGVASDWILYAGASVVLLGAAVVVFGRDRKRA